MEGVESIGTKWNIKDEILLFDAICDYKPAGKSKSENIKQILNILNENRTEDIFKEDDVWKKLGTLYNLEKIEEIEETTDGENGKDGGLSENMAEVEDKTTEKEEQRASSPSVSEHDKTPKMVNEEHPRTRKHVSSHKEANEAKSAEMESGRDAAPSLKEQTPKKNQPLAQEKHDYDTHDKEKDSPERRSAADDKNSSRDVSKGFDEENDSVKNEDNDEDEVTKDSESEENEESHDKTENQDSEAGEREKTEEASEDDGESSRRVTRGLRRQQHDSAGPKKRTRSAIKIEEKNDDTDHSTRSKRTSKASTPPTNPSAALNVKRKRKSETSISEPERTAPRRSTRGAPTGGSKTQGQPQPAVAVRRSSRKK